MSSDLTYRNETEQRNKPETGKEYRYRGVVAGYKRRVPWKVIHIVDDYALCVEAPWVEGSEQWFRVTNLVLV